MRDALNATGRPIFFALCGWHDWYAPPMPSLNYTGGYSLANSARIDTDDNSWAGVLAASDVMARLTPYARPGYWNDPDLLLSVDFEGRLRVSELQSRAQFSLWCILSAPLLISGSLPHMSAFTLQTYSNADAIAINQAGSTQGARLAGSDLLPCQGRNLTNCTAAWGKNTSSPRGAPTSWAVLLINAGALPAQMGCNGTCLAMLGLSASNLPLTARDVWSGISSTISQLEVAPTILPPFGGHRLLSLTKADV